MLSSGTPWFLVWGILLAAATVSYRRRTANRAAAMAAAGDGMTNGPADGQNMLNCLDGRVPPPVTCRAIRYQASARHHLHAAAGWASPILAVLRGRPALLKSYAPSLFARILGMPKGFRRHPGSDSASSRPWTACSRSTRASEAFCSTLYVSNPDVQTYPLQEISVPVLIINAKDDGLSGFGHAARASRRIRRSKLVAIDRGGHLLLGSEGRIKEEIAAFETSAT
jgi:pimeloyl-ACP methyl ester carboxylesterase